MVTYSLNNMEIFRLLERIDSGYQPSRDELDALVNRKQLSLKDKEIDKLPESISYLRSLETLNLEKTKITELPQIITSLSCLKSLNVSKTLIRKLPTEIGKNKKLRSLNISCTAVKELPKSIYQLSALESLDIHGTLISQLPSSFSSLNSLHKLNISSTRIASFSPEIAKINNLKDLDIHNTRISQLPPNFSQLAVLCIFDAHKTLLQELPNMSGLQSLKWLDLADTPLTSLPESIGNTSLYRLDLSNTKIQKLPESLSNIRTLKRVIICNTKVDTIPKGLELGLLNKAVGDTPGIYASGTPFFPLIVITKKTEDVTKLPDDTENKLKILHLSDLHFSEDATDMDSHYFFLKVDLMDLLESNPKLDYLVISGDASDRPKPLMYSTAVSFIQKLAKEFSVPVEKIVLVPGNHDCNRDTSEKAYNHDEITDFKLYNDRFLDYSSHLYEPIKGRPYPLEPGDQFEDYIFESDGLCFLGLNSCWQIDHKNLYKSSICMQAIQRSKSIWCDPSKFVKLAVWHHPIMGETAIQDTTFMDTLSKRGFSACLHGHIHEAKNDHFSYDKNHNIQMIGAGTFGAVKEDRADGIPRQYNLIEYDKNRRLLTVYTRKREKDNGTWEADARWGDKSNKPEAFYTVDCKIKKS